MGNEGAAGFGTDAEHVTCAPFLDTLSHLAATRHPEDQLSRCVVACFNESFVFRSAVLGVLLKACRLAPRRHDASMWRCVTQEVVQARDRRGLLDIVIREGDLTGRRRPLIITIENKLGAPLDREQLERYRGTEHGSTLVVVTAQHPDVPSAWLKRTGVAAIRWFHIHRALTGSGGTAIDKFICRAFREYLEGLEMAYRPVSRTDLDRIATTFRAVASPSRGSIVHGIAFAPAAHLIELLNDVARDVEDRWPGGGAKRHWGPGYYKVVNIEGVEDKHCLGLDLRRGRTRARSGRRLRTVIAFAFPFSPDEAPWFEIYGWDNDRGKVVGVPYQLIRIGRLLDRSHHLDRQRIVSAVLKAAEASPVR